MIRIDAIWLAVRRLNQGKFHGPGIRHGCEIELDIEQPHALVLERAAAIMSLIQSALMNRHDAYAYLKDVLTLLSMHDCLIM